MDISVTHDNLSAKDFNPLPRKEGDTLSRALYFAQYANFNPLPRKEGDCRHVGQPLRVVNFNPLPRKEGDYRHQMEQACFV